MSLLSGQKHLASIKLNPKYIGMLNAGMPEHIIRSAMAKDGITPPPGFFHQKQHKEDKKPDKHRREPEPENENDDNDWDMNKHMENLL